MSLINQVLENVEKRQGAAPADKQPWVTQVKPVLNHSDNKTTRHVLILLTVSIFVILLLWSGVVLTGVKKIAEGFSHLSSLGYDLLKEDSKPVSVTKNTSSSESSINSGWDGRPQLSRTLSFGWQESNENSKLSKQNNDSNKPLDAPKATQLIADTQIDKQTVDTKPKTEAESNLINTGVKEGETNNTVAVNPLAPESAAIDTNKTKAALTNAGNNFNKDSVVKSVKPEQEVNFLMERAVDHAQKGRTHEAIATLKQAVNQYPQSEDARELLASYLFDTEQEQEAVSVLQAGIASYPNQSSLRKALGKWQLAHAQPEAALVTLKPMLKMSAQDADWQWMMAMAYQQSGQHVFALPFFEKALNLRSGQAQWNVAYAMSLQTLGEKAEALKQLQIAQTFPMSQRMAEFVQQRIQQLSATTSNQANSNSATSPEKQK